MENEINEKLNQQAISYLKEGIEKIEQAMINGFTQVNSKLELMASTYIKREDVDRELKTRDEQIKSLQNNQTWVVRTIIGIVLTALLSLIIVTK